MRTRLTELLGVEHPVMLAGMGGVSYAPLVAAVSEAGGFGCLGASTMDNDRMVAEMAAVRAATDRPFGVDLLTAMPGGLRAQVELIIDGGASVFVAGLGVPSEVVEQCHDHGLLVVNMCGKVEHARRAVDAGCDMVVAQGTEAGGHTGQVAALPLVPQIVDAVGDRVPVVAAGGIFDGRGLAAALALGADGVWVGTRFIATPEARGVRLQGRPAGEPGGRHDGQPGLLGQDDAGHPERVHRPLRTAPRGAEPVPRAARPFAAPTAPSTSVATSRRRASTPPASATRPVRASGRSTSWSLPAPGAPVRDGGRSSARPTGLAEPLLATGRRRPGAATRRSCLSPRRR